MILVLVLGQFRGPRLDSPLIQGTLNSKFSDFTFLSKYLKSLSRLVKIGVPVSFLFKNVDVTCFHPFLHIIILMLVSDQVNKDLPWPLKYV